jgi:nucleotide-binding universal stress UspA family protein
LPIRKILVAVDGSNPSFNASTYAIDLAKRNEAELIVLYIVSPAPYGQLEYANIPYNQLEYANIGRMEEIETIEKERAQQEVDKVKQMAIENKVSVKTDVLIKYTSVVKEIVEYAEKKKVEMIVIGSRGMTGFKKLLLGSVASGVVTYSHCPVLVVK